MDRAGAVSWSGRAGAGRRPAEELLLASRSQALAQLSGALESGGGPVLLTGGPGTGKSWLCRRLQARMPAVWRWVSVDLSPAIDPEQFYRLVLHALGTAQERGPAESRTRLADLLAEAAADGESRGLIVEEAHNARDCVLEELRVLGNRLGEPGSFAGLVVVGQNPLARRLTTRPLAPLEARIAARVHLRPLGVEELRDWLTQLDTDQTWPLHEAEWLHRETAGNPRKILALASADRRGDRSDALDDNVPRTPRAVVQVKADASRGDRPAAWESAAVSPVRPPLRIGEGMIEVGWDANPTPATEVVATAGKSPEANVETPIEPANPAGDAAEELIDDHYAALQAWKEWAQNQGRTPDKSATATAPAETESEELEEADAGHQAGSELSPNVPGFQGVRAEGQHDFAPYSQLFSRLRQPRDTF